MKKDKQIEQRNNALAELAKDLKAIADWTNGGYGFTAIAKASRIVAELADIEPGRILGGRFDINSLLNLETAYENCRMIAEEGAGDGLGTR